MVPRTKRFQANIPMLRTKKLSKSLDFDVLHSASNSAIATLFSRCLLLVHKALRAREFRQRWCPESAYLIVIQMGNSTGCVLDHFLLNPRHADES